MNKILMSLLFGAFLFMGTSFAQTPPPAADTTAPAAAPVATPAPVVVHHHMHHPEIHKALRKLRGAKEDLEKATNDYGGHKAQAITAIDQAITELQAALDMDKK